MRSSLLISISILSFILLSASLSISDGIFDDFAMVGGDEPVLPEVPYDYSVDHIPDYLHPLNAEDLPDLSFITNETATLGRVLFYDELLSVNENLSCATCHQQALSFADKDALSQGVTTTTTRNAMQLNDLGWLNNSRFFWNVGQTNLEEAILLPLSNSNENGISDFGSLKTKMDHTTYYPDLFEKAFGDNDITSERVRMAIGQFISSMTTFNSKYDRVLRGQADFTQTEDFGRKLFDQDCSSCHLDGRLATSNSDFSIDSSPALFSNGLALSQNEIGAGIWNEFFAGLFKVTTLRNIELTAPYMHDGRFNTLSEVIDHYSDDISTTSFIPLASIYYGLLPVGGFNYNDLQKQSLLAFLKTFTDDSFLTDPKFSDPFASTATASHDLDYLSNEIDVYPNPTNGPLNISFENNHRQNVEVLLIGMDGKLIRKMSSHKNGLSTDVSQLTSGTYTVRVMASEGKWVDRTIVVSTGN